MHNNPPEKNGNLRKKIFLLFYNNSRLVYEFSSRREIQTLFFEDISRVYTCVYCV